MQDISQCEVPLYLMSEILLTRRHNGKRKLCVTDRWKEGHSNKLVIICPLNKVLQGRIKMYGCNHYCQICFAGLFFLI